MKPTLPVDQWPRELREELRYRVTKAQQLQEEAEQRADRLHRALGDCLMVLFQKARRYHGLDAAQPPARLLGAHVGLWMQDIGADPELLHRILEARDVFMGKNFGAEDHE